MTIAVTGAAGHLGRLTITALRARGVAAGDIVAVVRDAAKAADLAADGVQVRVADYADADALRDALAGVDKLLLVSGSEVGQRLPQHTNIIDAAEATGVAFIAYTSILHAATSPLILAGEHKATEELLAASGIDHALLRNGWYWENYDSSVAAAAASGALFGSAGAGRVAGAARKDFAEAAAAVLTTEGHAGAVYELGGERLTYTELAEVLSGIVGVPVAYKDLPKEEYAKILENAGVPAQFAAVLADSDAGIAVGALDTDSGDLERLIGRPATPAAEAIGA
ncbi:NmrA family NAD(P)-binding protein [Rhodococcus rhodochrous]|uniref:NmrA family NAD(P)-binding protein n=1 Tax=Rhodococcus rhodochrous TaxID=1829 RepID=UPI00132F0E8E|nr:NAD(P)H-binding protein [Rhodococcus rhodochrous]QHG83439.1 KR domain-containing protein [Rhodococcus rhodochrous]QOH56881.1 NAD(P)-dependent oxidoreductase [Rhodococcus rhodochrous]